MPAPAEIAGTGHEERVERPQRLQLALVRGDLVGLGDVVGERPDVIPRDNVYGIRRTAARFSMGRSIVARRLLPVRDRATFDRPPNVYSNPVAGTSSRSFS